MLLIGNGGSAAIVSHLHNDLTKAVGVRTLVFNEQPLLTALANVRLAFGRGSYRRLSERRVQVAQSYEIDAGNTSIGGVSELVFRKAPNGKP